MALIDPADIPEFEGNLAIIRYNAEKLKDVAKDVPTIASGAVTTYRTLYNVYSAPEADQLVSSLDPILTTSNDFGTGLQSLSKELLDFVEEMREVDNRLSEFAARARNFRRQIDTMYENGRKLARATKGMDFIEAMEYHAAHSGEYPQGVIPEGKSWNTNQNLIATNKWISDEVAKLVKRFFDIQIKYANRIAALCNGRKWNPENGQPDGWTIPLTPEQEVEQLVKGLFGTPTPTWAQPEEWDRPLALDILCAPGELVLETLDMVTTLTGMQWALREMGVTSIFGHQMADMYATKDAWVGVGKTFAMIVGELASVNPLTDAGFKAIVGKENAADLHRFGVEWAHGMVEDWKRNPAKAILGAAVSVVPIGGGLAALRTAGMASKIKPIAAVSRGAQKIVDFKAASIGKTLDLLHIPRVKDVINGRAQVPVIEMPQHVGIGSRGGGIDIPDGRPTVPHNQPGEVLAGINDRPGQQLPTTHQRPTETVPIEQRPVDHRPVEQRPVDHRPVEQRPVEQPARTPNDRGGSDTTHQRPGDDGRPVTRPEDRPGRPGDRHQEQQPVNPVVHQPVDRPGTTHGPDRTGTTRPPDRTGTPTTEMPRTHDRGGQDGDGRDTSTGRDRQPDRTTESPDRNPTDRTQTTPVERHGEHRRDEHGRDEHGRDEHGRDEHGRDESGREQTRTRREREQTPTQHQHERETQPTHERERETQPTSHGRDREPAPAGSDRMPDSGRSNDPTRTPETPPYVPYMHTGHPGGGGSTHGTGSPSKYSNPDFRASEADRDAYRKKHPITDHDRRMLEDIRSRQPSGVDLHDEELLAINRLMDRDHMEVNEARRNNDRETLDRHEPLINNGVAGMNKLPDHHGLVHRGIHVDAADMPDFLRRYEPGQTVREPGFTSSDKDGGYPGNVQFHIESRYGKDISFVRPQGGNKEVAHPPDNNFGVERREYDPDTDTWHIHLSDKGRTPDVPNQPHQPDPITDSAPTDRMDHPPAAERGDQSGRSDEVDRSGEGDPFDESARTDRMDHPRASERVDRPGPADHVDQAGPSNRGGQAGRSGQVDQPGPAKGDNQSGRLERGDDSVPGERSGPSRIADRLDGSRAARRDDQTGEPDPVKWPDRDPDSEAPSQRHDETGDPASDMSRRLDGESTSHSHPENKAERSESGDESRTPESEISRRLGGERRAPEGTRRPDANDPEFDWFTKPDRDTSGDTAPQATYKVGEVRNYGKNEARWTTTHDGQPRTMEATLRETHQVKRDADVLKAQRTVRTRGDQFDDAGHGLGHRFFPDQGIEGMFPQNKNFNRGAYKRLENEWADWTDKGHEVRVRVTPFPPGKARPDEIQVTYEVVDPSTGKTVWANGRAFFNSRGEAFMRHSNGSIKQFNPDSDLFDVDTGIDPSVTGVGLARKPDLPQNASHQGNATHDQFRQTFPELMNVNPTLGSTELALRNCQSAVDAAEQTLRGGPSSAVPGHPEADRGFQGSWKDRMTSRLGVPGAHFQHVTGYSEIVRLVAGAGDGTRAVVYGARQGLNGLLRSPHIFMVVNRGGQVHFIDPQIHSWANLQGYAYLEIMRTN